MPLYRVRNVIEARGIKAFFNLDTGVTRGPLPSNVPHSGEQKELQQARREIADKDRELARLQTQSVGEDPKGHIRPENIIWLFGTGRSGNTWLSSMMGNLEGHALWPEPSIGELFGNFYHDDRRSRQRNNRNFVMGDPERRSWLGAIRAFTLERIRTKFRSPQNKYLVVKEQRGSVGASLLSQALPESRMILLIRDPRDVVASNLDAIGEEGWAHNTIMGRRTREEAVPDNDPEEFWKTWAGRWAHSYLTSVQSAKQAYEAHEGPKVLVKYEDLLADTMATMKHIYSTLGIPVEDQDLAHVVENHSWENISSEEKGEGKFYRKASPGSWKDDLTPEQAEIVEETTAPLLEEFYGS
jgi:hypothetical protein